MSIVSALLAEVLEAIEGDAKLATRIRNALGVDRVTTPTEDRVFVTVADFAREYQISRRSVFAWIADGMPSVRRGRLRRIPLADARAWLDARQGA